MNDTDNALDVYLEKFKTLADEAHEYGIDTLYVLREHDRFAQTEEAQVGYTSGRILSVGLAEYARRRILWECEEDD